MEDKLKNFIRDNQDSFESDVPSNRVWEGIEKEFSKTKKPKQSNNIVAFITSIAAILVLGILIFKGDGNVGPAIAENNSIIQEINISSFSVEMGEVENFYIQEVNQKIGLLGSYEVDPELLSEIDFLKDEYSALKTEMVKSINPLEIIEMMIENYRLRLEILEDILKEFEDENLRDKSNNKKENETV